MTPVEHYTEQAEVAELVEALRKLSNEADGMVEMARPCIGNTNVQCLKLRIAEADALLARYPKEKA